MLSFNAGAFAQGTTASVPDETAHSGECISAIRLPRDVLADGAVLPATIYVVRLASSGDPDLTPTSVDQQWIEFVRNGAVAGRGLAWLVRPIDVEQTLEGFAPPANRSRVDLLNDGQLVRVWINWHGLNYVVHLSTVR